MTRGPSNGRYILAGHVPVECEDLMEWAAWMEQASDTRRVALTEVGRCTVSTVFLGLDHNYGPATEGPLLFETMAWRDEDSPKRTFEDIQERCSTWEEAERQHKAVVDLLRKPGDTVRYIT